MLVFFTLKARTQLRDIHDYIVRDNAIAARAVVMRIEAVVRFLETTARPAEARCRAAVSLSHLLRDFRANRADHPHPACRAIPPLFSRSSGSLQRENLHPLADKTRSGFEETASEMERGDVGAVRYTHDECSSLLPRMNDEIPHRATIRPV
jgi:hypothetical protein